jgi:CBS domain-containing protein
VEVVMIPSDVTIKSAATIMFEKKIGSVIVNDGNGKFACIVTERDIV